MLIEIVVSVGSNNNKLENEESSQSLDPYQEIEFLQKQLIDMAKEKSDLALELGEHKGQLQVLRNEIIKLKVSLLYYFHFPICFR